MNASARAVSSRRRVCLIAFAARPGYGSEGGVGWAFIQAAIKAAARSGSLLTVIADDRDRDELSRAFASLEQTVVEAIYYVRAPRWLPRRHRIGKTRLRYLTWLLPARRTLRKLHCEAPFDVMHQVTFASATMPPVMPTTSIRSIWGPLAVPMGEAYSLKALRFCSGFFTRRRSLVIANNSATFEWLAQHSHERDLEPNIVAEPARLPAKKIANHLAICGVLQPRKRVQIAIHALADESLSDFTLAVIGDGPERPRLEQLAREVGVQDRIQFRGRLSQGEARAAIGQAMVLIHPSSREGSPWVIGEAAAEGTPTVAFRKSGCEATVLMSDVGGVLIDENAPTAQVASTIRAIALNPTPLPSARWGADRLVERLINWWFPTERIIE